MAIGDTWETINTYAFTDGTTIITADFLNDAVNDLQFLYQRTATKVNMWTANTNTGVTIAAGTLSGILIGLSVTLTPNTSSVMCFFYATGHSYGWNGTIYCDFGYKVNSGSIIYFNQETNNQNAVNMLAITGLTAGSSNTITFYAKTVSFPGTATMESARAVLWEMAN